MLAVIVALIASKKGRSGGAFFVVLLIVPVPLMILISGIFGDDMEHKSFAMWLGAFLCPIIGFVIALMSDNAEQAAVAQGEFGDYRKCPFCAESVRREAIKCRHCQSNLTSTS
ncbi:hypothetical protein [Marmoricola sp. RAF53]|uniref:hypothetical protein n=1 Tax=Marmoricola sp. RAF53 TaxID=3233059 RepID=UPI003F95EF67